MANHSARADQNWGFLNMAGVWMIDCVVKCLPGSDWEHKDRAAAIFIECYVPTDDLHEALRRTSEALGQQGFEIVTFDRCMRYHEEHWSEQSEGHQKVRESVAQARKTNEVVVGAIRWRAKR
jgi:hypothetical protein